MATLPQQILALVFERPGLTDRQIANHLIGSDSPQQPVNIAARGLERKGMLVRAHRDDGLIGNYPVQPGAAPPSPIKPSANNRCQMTSQIRLVKSLPTELGKWIAQFVESVGSGGIEIYNEFSLQHELGIFLRSLFPDYFVQFERNVAYFSKPKESFTKREIDIVVFSKDKTDLKLAIELKYPRNGQHPEQMFSFCRDIAFAEELQDAGFSRTAVLIFVDDPGFYAGKGEGIYGYFRSGKTLSGVIEKPTGSGGQTVTIKNAYTIHWRPVAGSIHYTLIEIG